MNRVGTSVLRGSRHIARANFSTSPAPQLDLSNLYSKLTGWRRKRPANTVVDPTKAPDAEKSDDSMPVDSRPRKLRILGKPKALEDDWPTVQPFAEFTPWPTNHYQKSLSQEDIDAALARIKTVDFSDLQSRFEAVKQVSRDVNVAIPDPVFSSLTSVDALKAHLQRSAKPFDEKQPDAVYLDQKDFVGTNVTISDPVAERKAQKQKMHELVKQARDAQKRAADEIMRAN